MIVTILHRATYTNEATQGLHNRTKRSVNNAAIRLRRHGFDIELQWLSYESINVDNDGYDPELSQRLQDAPQEVLGDALWVRSIGSNGVLTGNVVRLALGCGVFVTDKYIVDQCNNGRTPRSYSKEESMNILEDAGVLVPPHEAVNPEVLLYSNVEGKVVRRSRGGRRGMYTWYIREQAHFDEMMETIANTPNPTVKVLVSPYIPNDGDYRCITVGGTCVGMFKRGPKRHDIATMSSSEENDTPLWVPDMDVARIAGKAAQALNIDFASMDIVKGPDGVVVIEVNAAPSFAAFNRHVFSNKRGVAKVADYVLSWIYNRAREQ